MWPVESKKSNSEAGRSGIKSDKALDKLSHP